MHPSATSALVRATSRRKCAIHATTASLGRSFETRTRLALFVLCGLFVGDPGAAHAVAGRRDVVLLDLFAVLPRLLAADREDHVDLAGVVLPVPCDHCHNLAKRRRLSPVERPPLVEIDGLGHRREPAFVAPVEPRQDLLDVRLPRLDPIAEPAWPVSLVPMPRLFLEGVRVVDG